jgi:hypothetical protein
MSSQRRHPFPVDDVEFTKAPPSEYGNYDVMLVHDNVAVDEYAKKYRVMRYDLYVNNGPPNNYHYCYTFKHTPESDEHNKAIRV